MLARNSDPISSHEAADDIVSSGKIAKQKTMVLQSLKLYAGTATSAELAKYYEMDRYMMARRLPDLEKEGHVKRTGMKKCEVTGKSAVAWGLAGGGA